MSVDVTSLQIKVSSQGINEANTSLKNLTKSAGSAENQVKALSSAMKLLNAANSESSKFADNLMLKLRAQDTLLMTMARNSQVAASGTQALAAAMASLSASLNVLNQVQQRTIVQQNTHTNAMREAHAAARGLSGSLGALWLTYGNFAGMAVGLGIGVALKGIITIGADVENTLEGIRVRGQETIESVNQVREAVLSIGQGIYGPQQVAKAFESLTLAGLRVKESSLAIGAALNLATAGGTSIENAAEGLVSIGTAVGATAKSFDYLADGITAASNTSLASVDSITQAVKRASIVNKLYGASFDDVLTQTAALAQLGIKNTAAGTAITNFYNNAVGNTQKSRKALDELGMSFTDATGKAKPLVAAYEEFTAKLNKFDLKSQQNFINDIFGERALRDVEGLRDLVNRSADDSVKYSNKLREVQGQIAEAAGTASLQSVQLGLTTQKQLDAVSNTLKTSFTKAFEDLSPALLSITARLKETFASQAFITGLTNIGSAFGSIVGFVMENTTAMGYLIEAFIVFKTVVIAESLFAAAARGLMSMSVALGAVTVATTGATVATGALGLAMRALPVIGPILTAVSVGMALMAFHTEKANDATKKISDTYNTDFLKALEDEADRLERTNKLMLAGASASDAQTQSLRDQALARFQLNGQNAIAIAQANLDAVAPAYNTARVVRAFTFDKDDKEAVAYNKAKTELDKVKAKVDADNNAATKLTGKIVDESNKKKSAYQEEQKAAENASAARAGTGVYDRKQEDKAGSNDIYAAQLKRVEGEIEAGKRGLAMIESSANSKYKAGLISEFDQIDAISKARVEKLTKDVSLYQKMLDTAAPKNRRAVAEAIGNKQANAEDLLDQEKQRRQEEYDVALKKMQDENYNNHYKQLVLQGRNEKAAIEKSKRLFQDKIKTEELTLVESLQKMSMATGPEAETLRVKIATLAQSLTYAKGETEALISKGKIDDAELNTQKALEAVRVQIVGIKAAIPQGGLFAGIAADKSIASIREKAIPELERLYAIQQKLADTTKSPDAMKNLAKTGEELQKLREKSGGVDAWTGAQESIRKYAASATDAGTLIGDAMTNAFKGAEDALTTFIMTGKINFRSLASSIVADLARIQAKQMLMSISGGDSGGGGIFGSLLKMGISSLAGAFGGAAMGTFGVSAGVLPTTNASVNGNLDWMSGIKGFADGGSPPLGQISMVGEEGPELFIPKSAGTIIPNHALQGPMQNGSSGSSDQPTQYTIVNQTTGRIDEVKEQRLNGNERALIIKETLSAVASSLYDANSNVSKGIKNNHNIQRVR